MIALAWRNLWRQPRRTLLTLLAIAFACLVMVFLLALQVGTYASMKDNTMRLFDGYAQVQPRGYLDDPGIRKSFGHAGELARSVARVPGVTAVAARAQTYALLSKGSRSLAAMVVGVDPAAERRVSRIASTLRAGRYLRPDTAEIVLGQALARNLGVAVGDRVTLLGMGRDGSVAADVLTVAGIFSSGVKDLDRQLAEIPLRRFQGDFVMPDMANVLALSGASLDAVNRALPAIRRAAGQKGLSVRSWGELEPGLKNAIQLDASTSMLWYVVLVVVSVAILLNTILMSILERTREFGILLALGMRPMTAARMVWLEILMLLAVGLTLGIGLGAAAAGWYAVHGLVLPGAEGVFAQWGLPGRMYPQLTPFSLLAAPAAIACFTALAGVFPLLRLRRLEPVAAMRAA
ncbi:MAG: ABC transporter permease [Acidihalobacter sp.]|uniref:FtsX-like permease family protein n=1 Tax=Acidihalobacter sp. TaxID=1872108 RepID=UPI00307E30AA